MEFGGVEGKGFHYDNLRYVRSALKRSPTLCEAIPRRGVVPWTFGFRATAMSTREEDSLCPGRLDQAKS
jgi:hypothetical protein